MTIPKALGAVNLSYEQVAYLEFNNELLEMGYTKEEIEKAWQKIQEDFPKRKRHVHIGTFVRGKIAQAKRGIYEL